MVNAANVWVIVMFADERQMNHGFHFIVRLIFVSLKINCSRTEVQLPFSLFQKIRYHLCRAEKIFLVFFWSVTFRYYVRICEAFSNVLSTLFQPDYSFYCL